MPKVNCPKCGTLTEYDGNPFRPFCSERCKMIDLGAWIDEEYAIASDEAELTEEDIEALEKALNSRDETDK